MYVLSPEATDLMLTKTISYNDLLRHSERHLRFDVAELKRVAAESIGKKTEDVIGFKKFAEGGFNRSFEITMRDGCRILARIPYPITLPKHLAVASEVATMDLVRSYGIPVPKIYGYSATMDNGVGTEYIIMEAVAGKDVGDIWFHMSEKERLKLIFKVVEMEALLFSIRLPASGSIYYAHDLDAKMKRVEIPGPRRGGKRFCIGPDTSLGMWYGKRSLLSVDRGPCKHPQHGRISQHLMTRRHRSRRGS